MDHQWGDFVALGWGGWDWFAGQLADGRDLALAVARDPTGAARPAQGTLVDAAGAAHPLPPGTVELEATGAWTSARSGARYPSGWRVRLPQAQLDLLWVPLLEDQELDARGTTGVVYWEGAVLLRDAGSGADLGRGYVELTGYATAR
jgi:predicted secreted hydrolase